MSHPSSHPHEPTISEEANAYIGRSVTQAQAASHTPGQSSLQPPPMPQQGSPRPGHSPASPRHFGQPQTADNGTGSSGTGASTPRDGLESRDPPRERERRDRDRDREHPSQSDRPANAHSSGAAAQGTTKRRQYRQVGDWILQKTLGQGSMGKVKLGVNVHTQERCAVKIVPRHRDDPSKVDSSGRSKDESKEIRTVREASISLLLHHPYICGMRDFLVHQNHYYMVFEYIDGGQMLDYIIAHGRLRERAARKFARQIGSALDYCHHNNIVHRDLKIENILISNNGNIKIIDFGLSNLYSPMRHLSTFCGSLYFAAPELLNAKLYTGPEVDVWSFGIVLYVLVCGKVPFDDQSMPALHAKIKRGLAEYPAWLSNDCKALLQRMLNTNPQERATLSEVLSHPWMTKGFDGRAPESHIIHREPLRAEDLDMSVIQRMQGFTFGTPEEIHENLVKILNSDVYQRCVAQWESRRDYRRAAPVGMNGSSSQGMLSPDNDSPKKKRFSGFDLKKKFFKEEKKAEEPAPSVKEPLDPSSGFDPLISIYFLAREKKERSKVYGDGHFASSRGSVDANSIKPTDFNTNLPSVPAPAMAHAATNAMAYGTTSSSQRDNFSPQQPKLRAGELAAATAVMQHPTADSAKSNIADIPTAARRDGRPQANNMAQQQPSSLGAAMEADGRRQSVSHERRISVGSMTGNMAKASLSRRASQRNSTNTSTSGTAANPITPPDWTIPMGFIQDKSGGIRPIGSPELDEIEPADVANIDVKSVYLKGLFSVSTTSTKSARTLLKDISHVLDRIGIKYRPIRGGFECIHVPSIDLKSVVHGDEARSQLHVPVGQMSIESSPSKNKLSLRNAGAAASTTTTSRGGDSPSPADRGGSSSGTVGMLDSASVGPPAKPGRVDLDDADAWGAQFGASSTLCVRFEVFVVKVSSHRSSSILTIRSPGSLYMASSSGASAATAGSTSNWPRRSFARCDCNTSVRAQPRQLAPLLTSTRHDLIFHWIRPSSLFAFSPPSSPPPLPTTTTNANVNYHHQLSQPQTVVSFYNAPSTVRISHAASHGMFIGQVSQGSRCRREMSTGHRAQRGMRGTERGR